jgi:HAD superfamily hydrolase (TIGR01459 family)
MQKVNKPNSFLEIIDLFDLFLVDLWGVTHNGKTPFIHTLEVLKEAQKRQKKVWFLSNAPRLPIMAEKKLSELGVSSDLYDGICTSGLACFNDLKERRFSFYQKDHPKLFHIGEKRDESIFQKLDFYEKTEKLEDTDFIILTGIFNSNDNLEDYQSILGKSLFYKIPITCANADLEVMYGDKKIICAGAIGKLYEQMGGKVIYYGKPDSKIYSLALELSQSEHIAKERILMIGDSLNTDILGANNFGIKSILVGTGILQDSLKECTIEEIVQEKKIYPDYFMDVLKA